MPLSQFVFFAGWLVVALLGGALLYYAWPWLCAKLSPNRRCSAGKDRVPAHDLERGPYPRCTADLGCCFDAPEFCDPRLIPMIALASAEVAISRPSSLATATTLRTA